jgi:signal transduction histidine kinase
MRGIAHDFNNLLLVILGNVDLSLMDLRSESPIFENVTEIKNAALRAVALCRNMLSYGGIGKSAHKPVDISSLARDVSVLLGVSLPEGCELRYELDDQAPLVLCNETQVRQVIMNLVLNAAQSLASGKGVVTVRTFVQDGELEMSGRCYLSENHNGGPHVCLVVEDTGCGIDDAVQEGLFRTFATTKSGGHGLGLAVVHRVVRDHHGVIGVQSGMGKGSRFTVMFPVSEQEADQAKVREP